MTRPRNKQVLGGTMIGWLHYSRPRRSFEDMIQQKSKPEMFAKPGARRQEDMLTIQVKNTTLRLNGQNLKLAAKNGRNSKTPGLHLSATRGRAEALGRLTASSPTQEGTLQLDLSELESARPESERPARRPLKLAPLDLPDEVREAQREKLKFVQEEAKPSTSKPDTRPVKPRPAKVAASPESLRPQLDSRSCRPQLTRCHRLEQTADKTLEEVVCRGTSAPLCSKPAPPALTARAKAPCVREAVHQNAGILQQEAGRGRRLRLTRVRRLEEDQCTSNTSTRGLSAEESKLAQGGRSKAGAQKGQSQAGKIKEPAIPGDARKSRPDDGSQQAARRTTIRQAAESGSGERGVAGTKPNACNLRLKRRKDLITKHNNAAALERLQL